MKKRTFALKKTDIYKDAVFYCFQGNGVIEEKKPSAQWRMPPLDLFFTRSIEAREAWSWFVVNSGRSWSCVLEAMSPPPSGHSQKHIIQTTPHPTMAARSHTMLSLVRSASVRCMSWNCLTVVVESWGQGPVTPRSSPGEGLISGGRRKVVENCAIVGIVGKLWKASGSSKKLQKLGEIYGY